MKKYILRLFVVGKMPAAERAIKNLLSVCEKELKGRYELEIIDVLDNPKLAENEHILATPTLIKQSPPPVSRILGDFCNEKRVLKGLDILFGKSKVINDSDVEKIKLLIP